MKYDFRRDARAALARARTELDSKQDERIRYAALELRMCIESLAYERALDYEDDLPPSEYETWQPKKLVELLIDIEPTADKGGELRIKLETAPGEPEQPWQPLGEERVFGLKQIGDHYHRLGSLLHQPTLKNLLKDSLSLSKYRDRCADLVKELDAVLSSPIYNMHFRSHVTFACECGKNIRKRVKVDGSDTTATCECKAQYLLRNQPGTDGYRFERVGTKIPCKTPGCDVVTFVGKEHIKHGTKWMCEGCGAVHQILLNLIPGKAPGK